jgi:hypothetical protein
MLHSDKYDHPRSDSWRCSAIVRLHFARDPSHQSEMQVSPCRTDWIAANRCTAAAARLSTCPHASLSRASRGHSFAYNIVFTSGVCVAAVSLALWRRAVFETIASYFAKGLAATAFHLVTP